MEQEKLETAFRHLRMYCLVKPDSVVKRSIETLLIEYDRLLETYKGLEQTMQANMEDK